MSPHVDHTERLLPPLKGSQRPASIPPSDMPLGSYRSSRLGIMTLTKVRLVMQTSSSKPDNWTFTPSPSIFLVPFVPSPQPARIRFPRVACNSCSASALTTISLPSPPSSEWILVSQCNHHLFSFCGSLPGMIRIEADR